MRNTKEITAITKGAMAAMGEEYARMTQITERISP